MKLGAKRNCILGYAVGLKAEDVRLFCESAMLSVKTPTDIVLFGSDISLKCKIFNQCRLIVIPTSNIWNGMSKDRYKVRWALGFFFIKYFQFCADILTVISRALFESKLTRENLSDYFLHPSLARYVLYNQFSQLNYDTYNSILIADVRDVYFQRDPFVNLPGGLTTFLENDAMYCSETRNHRWIQSVYGKAIASNMKRHRSVCSGVSIGDADSMHHYLTKMYAEVSKFGCIPYSDQGIHNVLIRLKGLRARLAENRDGITLTAAGTEAIDDFKIREGKVYASNDALFAIIHQYDRHKFLLETLQQEHTKRLVAESNR